MGFNGDLMEIPSWIMVLVVFGGSRSWEDSHYPALISTVKPRLISTQFIDNRGVPLVNCTLSLPSGYLT